MALPKVWSELLSHLWHTEWRLVREVLERPRPRTYWLKMHEVWGECLSLCSFFFLVRIRQKEPQWLHSLRQWALSVVSPHTFWHSPPPYVTSPPGKHFCPLFLAQRWIIHVGWADGISGKPFDSCDRKDWDWPAGASGARVQLLVSQPACPLEKRPRRLGG